MSGMFYCMNRLLVWWWMVVLVSGSISGNLVSCCGLLRGVVSKGWLGCIISIIDLLYRCLKVRFWMFGLLVICLIIRFSLLIFSCVSR